MKENFESSFDYISKQEEGEHTYQVILGMADLWQLEMYFDLEKDLAKWSGTSLSMVKRGFWQHENIDKFWTEVGRNKEHIIPEPASPPPEDQHQKQLQYQVCPHCW